MYKAHARHLLSIAFVIYVVAAIIELLLGVLGPIGALLAAIVSIVAAFLLQAARPAVGRVALVSIVAGIGIAIGLVLLIVPGLYLLTIWCLVVPVVVLEGAETFAALGRSRELVRGHGWQVFGTLVLVFIVLLVVGVAISLLLVALPMAARNFISNIVSGTLVSPFLALVLTLGYFRLLAAERGGSAGEPPAPPYPTGYGTS